MRAILAIIAVLSFLSPGCTTMPKDFTNGDKKFHPRWGYRITNEGDSSLDLEVCVIWYAAYCTNGGTQLEDSKAVFLTFAREYAASKKKLLGEVSPVELYTSHLRNPNDGGCSVRVSKRLAWHGETGAITSSKPPAP